MKSLVVILSLFLFIIFTSCRQSSVDPVQVIKTPRQMTWTCDTLTSPDNTSIQLIMRNIVAFSPKDVWITGWSDVSRGLIWHYDGSSWKESNIANDIGTLRIDDLAGSSGNDLWAGGYSNDYLPDFYACFAHYDGNKWTKYPHIDVKGEVIDMTKDPEGNLWACARDGVVFKLINGKWTADTIKIGYDQNQDYYWLRSIEYFKDRIFIIATVAHSSLYKYYYITGDMKNWAIQDSFIVDSPDDKIKWGNQGLFAEKTGKIFSSGLEGIWEYQNGCWNQSYKIDCTVYNGIGIGPDYIIAVGDFQQVLFHNGSTWDNFYELLAKQNDSIVFTNAWTNGNETFIIGYTTSDGPNKTIVWHGK
jgi:hypothetical protein